MQHTPYYFTTDDKTRKTLNVFTTNVLEPTEETRTRLKVFRYTNSTYADVYETMWAFLRSHKLSTGGSHLFEAWEEAQA